MFKWNNGRQGGDYQNMKIISCKWFDLYLIRFKAGFKLPVHVDAVTGRTHHRLNIRLYGEDAYFGDYIWKWWRFIHFRSDQPHGTDKLKRNRMLLSIGWTKPLKDEQHDNNS